MKHPLLDIDRIDQAPETYLKNAGNIFAVFGEDSQDSGNVSYGVQIHQDHFFVKTAGDPDNPNPYLNHAERVSLLRNAIQLQHECSNPVLPQLHHIIGSPQGPLLIYEWARGELIRPARERFKALPTLEITRVLDQIYVLHRDLAQLGYVAIDFYDGCLIYDFDRQILKVMDLEHYHIGPFKNKMGRMFGSSRFMAPEEFELGATIDERTTVFTMGRTAAVLLSDNTLDRKPFCGTDAQFDVMCHACQDDRNKRFQSLADFHTAWINA